MLRKVVVIVAAIIACVSFMSGCKKKTQPEQIAVKTMAEYEADANQQITKENMADELNKIEKAVDNDISQE